jgi:hypothetical protein
MLRADVPVKMHVALAFQLIYSSIEMVPICLPCKGVHTRTATRTGGSPARTWKTVQCVQALRRRRKWRKQFKHISRPTFEAGTNERTHPQKRQPLHLGRRIHTQIYFD